jgi:gluconolactonase
MMLLTETPEIRMTEVFTRMPEKFRRKGELTSWARANRLGVSGDSFLEGPVFDEAGNLFVTDIEYGRIFRIDPQGSWELVVEYDGEPTGMKFLSARELIVADYKNGLVAIDVHAGAVRPFLPRRNSERFRGVNDLVFDSKGNLYFTDQGQTGLHDPTGRVYRLSPEGRLDMLLGNVPSPNGLVLSPDEKVLFVAVTRGNCIWRAPLMLDGSVSKVGQYFSMDGPAGPDGLAMDVDGRLLIANPGIGVVWVLDRFAQPVQVLRSAAGTALTNIAFGGESRKTLYCTESETGTILRATLSVSGCKLHVPGRCE